MHPYVHCSIIRIAKIWKQPKCPSVDEKIKKLCHIYTMEHYLAFKRKEILPFGTARMDLESIMLSEISRSEKDELSIISLICEINEQNKPTNMIETGSQVENRLTAVRGQGCNGGAWLKG